MPPSRSACWARRRRRLVSRSPAFTAYVAAPVYRDGYLYGHGGDFLRCLKASDGTTAWEERTYPALLPSSTGRSSRSRSRPDCCASWKASPQAYRERARLQVLEPRSRAETPPSVVGCRIYVRNDEEVVAADAGQPSRAGAEPASRRARGRLVGRDLPRRRDDAVRARARARRRRQGAVEGDGAGRAPRCASRSAACRRRWRAARPSSGRSRSPTTRPRSAHRRRARRPLAGLEMPLVLRNAERFEAPVRTEPDGTLPRPPGPSTRAPRSGRADLRRGIVFAGADGRLLPSTPAPARSAGCSARAVRPHPAVRGRRRALLSGGRRLPLQARRRERGGSAGGSRSSEPDRAPALRRPDRASTASAPTSSSRAGDSTSALTMASCWHSLRRRRSSGTSKPATACSRHPPSTGRVLFGSYDRFLYALDATSGRCSGGG